MNRTFFVKRLLPCLLCLWTLPCFSIKGLASPALDAIIARADEFNKPILLFCLKGASCPWSSLVKERILSSVRFHKKMEKIAWVQTIYEDPSNESGIHLALRVDKLPCIILLDPRGREFARCHYDQSEPEEFASQIEDCIHAFQDICFAIDEGLHKQNEEGIRLLYEQSKRLSDPSFTKLFLHKGCEKERGVFFHLEKYASLLKKGSAKHPAVRKWKEKLLAKDPHNRLGVHREVAWMEFRMKARAIKGKEGVKQVSAPLIAYLKEWGDQEKERWKIEVVLAKFFFTREEMELASLWAKKGYLDAPEEKKRELQHTFSRLGVSL